MKCPKALSFHFQFFQAKTFFKPFSLQNWISSLHLHPILLVFILQWHTGSDSSNRIGSPVQKFKNLRLLQVALSCKKEGPSRVFGGRRICNWTKVKRLGWKFLCSLDLLTYLNLVREFYENTKFGVENLKLEV